MPKNKFIKKGVEHNIDEFEKLYPNQEKLISKEFGQSIMASLSEKDIEGHNSFLIENYDTNSLIIRFDCLKCESNYFKNRIDEHYNWEKAGNELEYCLKIIKNMQIMNKNVLIIGPKKELFDSFMTNTICKHGLQKGNKFAFLEFNYYQKLEASRLLEVIRSSPYSNYDQGIVLFPLEEKSNQFKHEQMTLLNDFLFSNGIKRLSGVTLGHDGVLDGVMLESLHSSLISQ
jgi:hypothetical protein